MPNYTWYVVGEIFGYSVLIITNIALLIGAAKKNRQGFLREESLLNRPFPPARFCFIPWLVAHMVTIIGLFIGALVIMIFFIFLFPLVNYALLAIIPLISAAILLYW